MTLRSVAIYYKTKNKTYTRKGQIVFSDAASCSRHTLVFQSFIKTSPDRSFPSLSWNVSLRTKDPLEYHKQVVRE